MFSQKGVEASKKNPKTEYSQPDSSRNKLEIIQSKSIASFLFVPQKHLRPVNMCRL